MTIALSCLCHGSAGAQEVIDRVMAVAAGDVILLSDVRAVRELGLVIPPDGVDPTRFIVSALIDRALMLDEVRRYAPPEPSADDVERALFDVRARSASPEAFAATLRRAGLDEAKLTEMLRQALRIRAYLAQRFSDNDPERARAAIDDWLAGLRRRGDVVESPSLR